MWLDHITSSGLGSRRVRSKVQNERYIPTPFDGTQHGTVGAQERNRLLASVNQALSSDNSRVEPPDPIPNSEVKRSCADGSVALPCESRSSVDIYSETPDR